MAETSGFATDLPQSAYLAHTIRRAISAAQQRSHRYVTLEHLLLALLDDADALALMEVARTDVGALRGATNETVNHSLATLYTPGAFDLRASYKVERVLQSASDDARRMGCTEVDGAFVAVALFHETDSPAYDLLKRHNFVFHAANGWIMRNRGAHAGYSPPPPPAAAPRQPAIEQSPAPPPPPVTMQPPAAPAPSPPPEPVLQFPSDEEYAEDEDYAAEEEAEEEFLLDDMVVEDDAPVSAGREEPEAVLPPYLRKEAPAREAHSPPAPSRDADTDDARYEPVAAPAPAPRAPVPPRPPSPPVRPAAEAQPRPEPAARPAAPPGKPDLGSAVPARELSPPPSQEGAVPMGRSRQEPGNRQRTEPRTGSESPKSEPRLTIPAAPGRSDHSPVPAKTLSHRIEGQTIEPRFDPPAPASSEGLGSAVPARDRSIPGEAAEVPPRAPAPIRERRITMPNGAHGDGERRETSRAAPSPAPAPSRLDDMRVRQGPGSPPVPPAPPATPVPAGRGTAKKGAREKDSDKARRRRPPSPGSVYAGKMAENIPRKMRAFKTETIEVRITREETESTLASLEGAGGGEAVRHDLLVTQAMSVMLRAPDGGFTIENLGPETQWIFNDPSFAEKEPFGRWRWSVTPNETGKLRLQLVVAARSVDQNGLAGDTAMPDQVIEVRVRTNYGRSIAQGFRWIFLLVLGGVVTEGTLMLLRILGKTN